MAIRNDNLGGTDFTDGEVLFDYDLDDTVDELLKQIGTGQAQLAYQTLQANNVFDNKDFLVADEFVSETGTNSTLNSGSTTGLYDETNDYYIARIADEASGDTTHDPDSFTDVANAFDNDDSTFATKASGSVTSFTFELGKTFSAKTVLGVYYKYTASHAGGSTNPSTVVKLQTYNGSTWSDHTTLTNTSGYVQINSSIQGVRLEIEMTSDNSAIKTANVFTLEYGQFYEASSDVVCDSSVANLDGNEKSLVIYADKDTSSSGSDITLDVTDGTTSITSQSLNDIINISSFTSGSLGVTFNMITSGTINTPTLSGYGVRILK